MNQFMKSFVIILNVITCLYSTPIQTSAISPQKVTIQSVKLKSGTSVTLKWKKAKNIDGYEIYRSTKKKSQYKKVKTIKNPNTTSAAVGNAVNGKTYYYKIRSYITGEKATLYGSFSSVKSLKMTYYAYKGESKTSKNKRIFKSSKKKKYTSKSQANKNMKTIKVKVWDFNSKKKKITKTKTLKVHKNIAPTVKQIFNEIYHGKEKFPIHS